MLSRSDLFDVFVNLSSSDITVSPHAKGTSSSKLFSLPNELRILFALPSDYSFCLVQKCYRGFLFTEYFTMGKLHKDIALHMMQSAEDTSKSEQQTIKVRDIISLHSVLELNGGKNKWKMWTQNTPGVQRKIYCGLCACGFVSSGNCLCACLLLRQFQMETNSHTFRDCDALFFLCVEFLNKAIVFSLFLLQNVALKTKELLNNLRSLSTSGENAKPVITLETLKGRKMAPATENFLFNLASAEGWVPLR